MYKLIEDSSPWETARERLKVGKNKVPHTIIGIIIGVGII